MIYYVKSNFVSRKSMTVYSRIALAFFIIHYMAVPCNAQMKIAPTTKQTLDDIGRQISIQVNAAAAKKPNWQTLVQPAPRFPLPLYNGKDTQFLVSAIQLTAMPTKTNFLALRTNDSAQLVAKWYEEAIAKSGMKVVNNGFCRGLKGIRMIKSESPTLIASVLVIETPGAYFRTNIQLIALERNPGSKDNRNAK